MPSFYQADLFRALNRTGQLDLKVIFTGKIPGDRTGLGWQDDLDGFEYEFLNEHHLIVDAFRKSREYRDHIHIVNGLWAGRVTKTALVTLLLSRSQYFIYSEAPDPRDTVPFFKHKMMMAIGKPIVQNAAGLLSISHFAAAYFKSYGADDSCIHPFGYFRSMPREFGGKARADKKGRVEVVFVGQLVHRKGVDVLLSAMEPLLAENGALYLQLIGSGDMENGLRGWVEERGLSSRISFKGTMKSQQVIGRISEADLLVLPSRWDGWGLVVNEALMAGVPVIVSDMCGASDLVKKGENGFVFNSEDVLDLRTKLADFLTAHAVRIPPAFPRGSFTDVKDADAAAQLLVEILRGIHHRFS